MAGKRVSLIGLGILAAALCLGSLFLAPVRVRIAEEWYLRKLGSAEPIERRRAGEQLAELGSIRAIPRLVALFPTDDSEAPPRWVVRALVRTGKPGIDAAFALKRPDGRIHPSVFEAIRDLGAVAVEAVPALVACLGSQGDGEDAASLLVKMAPQAIPPLVRALEEGTAESRRNAAYALGWMDTGAAQSVPALLRALGEREPRVRAEAAKALGNIGAPSGTTVVRALAAALKDEERDVREAAAEALGEVGPTALEAVPALVEALDPEKGEAFEAMQALRKVDPEGKSVTQLLVKLVPEIRRLEPRWTWSVWALENFAGRSPEVANALLELTREGDRVVRKQAAQALSRLSTEEARRRLFDLLRDRDREVRFAVADALARTQNVAPDEALPIFVEELKDPESNHRANAAFWLGRSFGSRAGPAVPILIACLRDHDPVVRDRAEEALVTLAMHGAKDALGGHLSDLTVLLGDPRPEVRWGAAVVLKGIGPPAAAAVLDLLKALEGADDDTARALIDAIGAIGPGAKAAVPTLVSKLESSGGNYSESIEEHAVKALGEIGEAGVPALIAALSDRRLEVRKGAASAIGEIPAAAPVALPALLKALGDPAAEVRSAAAYSLGQLGKGREGIISALTPLLRDSDSRVRFSASETLLSLGAETGLFLPVLISLFDDLDAPRLHSTMGILHDLGPAAEPAVPALVRLLKHDDDDVVKEAVWVLRKIGQRARAALPALREVSDSLPGSPFISDVERAIAEIGK